jgi:hypothetical protein
LIIKNNSIIYGGHYGPLEVLGATINHARITYTEEP